MAVKFKQLCVKCKKNYILVGWKDRYPICYECQKHELKGEIKDPAIKKLFDIPEEFYRANSFLRSIKINYLKFGNLSEKQIEYFKKTVEKLKEQNKKSD